MNRYRVLTGKALSESGEPVPVAYVSWEQWLDDLFYNGDAEYYDVLYDTVRKQIVYIDGGEPEDMTLGRDLRIFVDELNRLAKEE